jgi:putative hemolysin
MKRQITIIGTVLIVGMNLFGCASTESAKIEGPNEATLSRDRPKRLGTPDPSAVYCHALGYKLQIVTEDDGGQYGICIFPDGRACETWDFYRGKCGQKWSYCERCGYDLKDIKPHEGWVRGAVCVEKTTREEIGNLYTLVVDRFLKGECLTELRR